jgi:hypothetical protein
MHAIPQVLKAPGEPIDGAWPPPLAKIVKFLDKNIYAY